MSSTNNKFIPMVKNDKIDKIVKIDLKTIWALQYKVLNNY